MLPQLIEIRNGRAVTDSLIVAEQFEKDHLHVMRDIRVHIEKLAEAGESEWADTNFGLCDYANDSAVGINRNRRYPKYDLTEEAFALVAMSYTTPKAMKMKVKFIEEFKRMRAVIMGHLPLSRGRDHFHTIDRLTQMLKMSERDHIFNFATESAIRRQLAEEILGHPLPSTPSELPEPETERPQWVKDSYSAKAIGQITGCHYSKVGTVANQHGLKTEEYGTWYEYLSHGKSRKMFLYNERGRDELVKLLHGDEVQTETNGDTGGTKDG